MNIFLPYETNAKKSIESLDNRRLNKQIEECKVMLQAIINKSTKGYINHPVTQFYKNNPQFIAYYGYECCRELAYRTGTWHKFVEDFDYYMQRYHLFEYDEDGYIISMIIPKFIPFYMEGSVKDPAHIRAIENVGELFKQKLIKKWNADCEKGRAPKWTNREKPEFWKGEEYANTN